MNAVLKSRDLSPVLLPMTVTQLDAVLAIESAAYEFPWSRGNFVDSLAAGYWSRVLQGTSEPSPASGADGTIIGYMVAMPGVEEMHLLNVTVAPVHQGRGHARAMLAALVRHARGEGARRIWLEVRVSNTRARALYERLGYRTIGVRKGYYPAADGHREDALVMNLLLSEVTHGVV